MNSSLDAFKAEAFQGTRLSGGATSTFVAGVVQGGTFCFDDITIGLMLSPLASHRAAYASDRLVARPLAAGEGWVFPGSAEGTCIWNGRNDFVTITLPKSGFDALNVPTGAVGQMSAGQLDPLTVALVMQIHQSDSDDAVSAIYRDTMAGALTAHLSHNFIRQPVLTASTLDDARFKRAQIYISEHLASPISLEHMASEAGMSPFHFARAFKAKTGLAPHQFLVAARIDRAKSLLSSTGISIAEIAAQVGWENPSKFAAQFKKHVGATPGQWRAG